MKLVVAPDDVLKKKCRMVEAFDAELRQLVEGMLDVMYTHDGVGIAAPQVGFDLRVIVVDRSAGEDASACRVMINPEIVRTASATSYQVEAVEGCLSLPGQSFKVKRSSVAKVRWQTLAGEHRAETFEGFEARIVQHEIDHLMGILISDHGTF
jgi:peptide deformylase